MEHDLLESILDGREDPTNLPFVYLKNITEHFSEEREIGRGGFATVYKGILPSGTVAVKRIMNNHTIDENLFYREVDSLLKVNHQNIVRFLGYCATTDQTAIKIEGVKEHIFAEIRERLLCFEYISNGSLLKHITDELRGLDWDTRYKLIREICEAIRYMHMEKHIIHMDLKPANILLDDHLVAKVADFGLSRLDDMSKTMSAARCGSFGYMAPEYLHGGRMSAKSDIYSLGVIIIELVTGYKDIANDNYNDVLRRWRHRWRKSGNETALGYRQVTKCIEIGLRCKEDDPFKRPFIDEIIRDINNMEDANWQISNRTESTVGQICPYSEDDILGIEPLELRFPFEMKEISCSFELTNDTDAYIAFEVLTSSPLPYSILTKKDIVPPQSKRSVNITLQSQGKAPRDLLRANEFTVRSTRVNGGLSFEDIKMGNMVDEVNLDVVFDTEKSRVFDGKILDVHPFTLLFPFQPNKLVTCSLNISNNSDEHVVFTLEENIDNCIDQVELGKMTIGQVHVKRRKHVKCFVCLPLSGTIPAQSTCTLVVTTQKKGNLREETDNDLVLKYCKAYKYMDSFIGRDEYSWHFQDASRTSEVHSVPLKATYVPQGQMTWEDGPTRYKGVWMRLMSMQASSQKQRWAERQEAIPPLIQTKYVEDTDCSIRALDAHPTEPWIMTGHSSSRVGIWDYETQKLMAMVKVPTGKNRSEIKSVLFIARMQWFLVGSFDGFIHVYNYRKEMQRTTSFRAGSNKMNYVESLAVHPAHPYVLSLSFGEIKIWDWDKGWECIKTIQNVIHIMNQIAFNPTDTISIAAASANNQVKVWNFDSPDPEYILYGHSGQVNCLYFFTRDDQQFLITGSDDKTAKIWDMQEKTCIKTLEGFVSGVISVISHPNLPLLITGTRKGPFYLWSSTNFRLKRVLYGARDKSYDDSAFSGLACLMGSRRIAIAQGKTISVVEIHDEEAICS